MAAATKNKALGVMHSPDVILVPPIGIQGAPQPGGIRLDRESSSGRTLFLLSSASVSLDVGRQLSSYAMKYYNSNVFPVPPSLLVFAVELVKMATFLAKMTLTGSFNLYSISFAYLVPSTLYALNNNIYYMALHYTTPAVWNVLMQCRLICIALVYRIYFQKTFTSSKWLGLFLLLAAIILLQFSGADNLLTTGLISWDFLIALGLALIASVFAAIGPVFTEVGMRAHARMCVCVQVCRCSCIYIYIYIFRHFSFVRYQ